MPVVDSKSTANSCYDSRADLRESVIGKLALSRNKSGLSSCLQRGESFSWLRLWHWKEIECDSSWRAEAVISGQEWRVAGLLHLLSWAFENVRDCARFGLECRIEAVSQALVKKGLRQWRELIRFG